MIKYLLPVACGLALFLSSCTKDCEYTCIEKIGSFIDTTTGTSKVRKSSCEDCDFPAVNIWKNANTTCTCK